MSLPAPTEKLREWLRQEAARCAYCGFCEPACPTLAIGPHRGYGPRGRVNLAMMLVEGVKISGEVVASLFTCLSCGACKVKCPASIDIPTVVRVARVLYNRGAFGLVKGEIPVRTRPGV